MKPKIFKGPIASFFYGADLTDFVLRSLIFIFFAAVILTFAFAFAMFNFSHA